MSITSYIYKETLENITPRFSKEIHLQIYARKFSSGTSHPIEKTTKESEVFICGSL